MLGIQIDCLRQYHNHQLWTLILQIYLYNEHLIYADLLEYSNCRIQSFITTAVSLVNDEY
jgi:hypothetical protein